MRHDQFIENIDGDYKRKIKRFYRDLDETLAQKLNGEGFWFDDQIQEKLDSILVNIYDANKQFSKSDHLWLVENSLYPNAACYGNGIFTINAGLFLANLSDAEIAFIICHELAHLAKEHSLNRVKAYISNINSKEIKKKITAAKRKRFGSTRAGLLIFDELNIDLLQHSQATETEADSVGLDLFKKTIYYDISVANSLIRLKSYIDRIKNEPIQLDTVFTANDFKFKRFWSHKETALFSKDITDDFALSSDTLETHPGLGSRISKVLAQSNTKKSPDSSVYLNPEEATFRHHVLKKGIESGHLDFAIEVMLHYYRNRWLSTKDYHELIVKILQKTIDLKKEHELNKYVPIYREDSEYIRMNEVRNFLHNIPLKHLIKLKNAYAKNYEIQFSE